MKDKNIKSVIALAIAAMPVSVSAALIATETIFSRLLNIVNKFIIPLLFSAAIIVFFYGIIKYLRSLSDGGKEEGKKIMWWGVIALFVMSSVWGLVYWVRHELNIGSDSSMPIPTIGEPPIRSV